MMIRRLALAIVLAIPAFAQASVDLNVGSKIKLSREPGGTDGVNGGRFGVTGKLANGVTDISYFETFCAERAQTVALGNHVYTVVSIGTTNSTGGVLTDKAAWAYTQFRNGTLAGFDYSSTANTSTNDSANALQQLVWEGITGVGTQGTLSAAAAALKAGWVAAYNAAVTANEWTSIGNVRIMQLVDSSGNARQDQLVMVPEAASLLVWSVLGAIGALGTWRFGRKQ